MSINYNYTNCATSKKWQLTALPRPLAGLEGEGTAGKGRAVKGEEWDRREGEGKGEGGEGKDRGKGGEKGFNFNNNRIKSYAI